MADERPGPAASSGDGADAPDPAKVRFFVIAAQRVLGAALVVLGIMAMNGVLAWGQNVGMVLAVAGLIDFFLVPLLLARRWKSRPE